MKKLIFWSNRSIKVKITTMVLLAEVTCSLNPSVKAPLYFKEKRALKKNYTSLVKCIDLLPTLC